MRDSNAVAARALFKMATGTVSTTAGAMEAAGLPLSLAVTFVACLIEGLSKGQRDAKNVVAEIRADSALRRVTTLEDAILKAAGLYPQYESELKALAEAVGDPHGELLRERLLAAVTKLFGLANRETEDLRELDRALPTEMRITGPVEVVLRDPADYKDADLTSKQYLKWVREQTEYIDLKRFIRRRPPSSVQRRELSVKLPVRDVYVRLKHEAEVPSDVRAPGLERLGQPSEEGRPELVEALNERRLVVRGDPGTGKSTFVQYIALRLAERRLHPAKAGSAIREFGKAGKCYPILLSAPQLAADLLDDGPSGWAVKLLDGDVHAEGIPTFAREWVEAGRALFLIDSLDECATDHARCAVTALLEQAAASEPLAGNRFAVTVREGAYVGGALLHGFTSRSIAPLQPDDVDGFLTSWVKALGENTPASYEASLRDSVRRTPEQLRANPLFLTIMCVLHWYDGGELPKERGELYRRVLDHLVACREHRCSLPEGVNALALLARLAYEMHSHPEGRQEQVRKGWAATTIEGCWRESGASTCAGQFLDCETVDSGIIVDRGDDVRFWHLNFQEFLAADHIERSKTEVQTAERDCFYRRQWRETVRLLATLLWRKDPARLRRLLLAVVERGLSAGHLAGAAECLAVLGPIRQEIRLWDKSFHVSADGLPRLLECSGGLFDKQTSQEVEIGLAVEATEAMGMLGDPRFSDPLGPLRDPQHSHWVSIPAGSFLMGSQDEDPSKPNYDSEAYEKESPVHPVELAAYRVARYPVTVCEYAQFEQDGGYRREEFWGAGGFAEVEAPGDWSAQQEHPTRPVINVSWYEASAYAAWATSRLRAAGHNGVIRLPAEAEWERAARGTAGRKYPWGDDEPTPRLLNYRFHVRNPTPVGVYSLGATPDGIYDLAGNVWEWCEDSLRKYPNERATNPDEPRAGRVLRGGSWGNVPQGCRSAYRNRVTPDYRNYYFGFRVVVSAGVD